MCHSLGVNHLQKKAAPPEAARFLNQLDPRVKRWLNTPDPEGYEDDTNDDLFERWLLKSMATDRIADVGGVMVDKRLLTSTFACVPERCSPATDRGRFRSCCADLTVFVTRAERARLSKHKNVLAEQLQKHEPRLAGTVQKNRNFFMDEDGDTLLRAKKRCVFSQLDKRGRIRCHLHPVHRSLGIDQSDLQPITCRLFPLVLVAMPGEKVLVTMISKDNYRAWGATHPRYFPCLSDPHLEPVLKSMGPTLDWVFGKGFSRAFKRLG
jgi:hypothetical protein